MLTFADGVAITASLALIVGSLLEQWRRDRVERRTETDIAQSLALVAEDRSRRRHPTRWAS